jgi:pyruvate dehydrogenase E2 component (dihydrolipoamide acetyltransferase)
VGDNISQGTLIVLLDTAASTEADNSADTDQPAAGQDDAAGADDGSANAATPQAQPVAQSGAPSPADESMKRHQSSAPDPRAPKQRPAPTAAIGEPAPCSAFHATPTVRRFARELGVDLGRVSGSGRKARILREDIIGFVKGALSTPAVDASPNATAGMATTTGIAPIPAVDFSRFGQVEEQELPRIKRISGPFLLRAWLNIPHVTHHDEVDVTEMEAFRKSLADEAQRRGVRVTALAFIMKAVAKTLARFPSVNS